LLSNENNKITGTFDFGFGGFSPNLLSADLCSRAKCNWGNRYRESNAEEWSVSRR